MNRARYAAEGIGTVAPGRDPDAYADGGVYVGQHDGREDGKGTIVHPERTPRIRSGSAP